MTQVYLTKEGLEKLKQELDYLVNTKRQEVANRIQEAKELGDLSENAEYSDAKDEQAWLEGRVLEVQNMIRNCQIIKKKPGAKTSVNIGCTVVVKNEKGEDKEYQIVGSQEADPINGRISNESPIGHAFLGAKVGDTVEFKAPKGVIKFEVINIK